MKRILCIGDSMIDKIDIDGVDFQCYGKITAMAMTDDGLFSYFLNQKKYHMIIISFGTIDLILGDNMFSVAENIVKLYNIAKQITNHVIVLSSISRYEQYNIELFFRLGKSVCTTLGNLNEKHFNGIYPNKKGRKRIIKRFKKLIKNPN